jgi:hypothetical protein
MERILRRYGTLTSTELISDTFHTIKTLRNTLVGLTTTLTISLVVLHSLNARRLLDVTSSLTTSKTLSNTDESLLDETLRSVYYKSNLYTMTLQDKIYHTNEIANAIQRREEYFTIVGKEVRHFELPTPQTAGTMIQQRTYAMDKAMDILTQFYPS